MTIKVKYDSILVIIDRLTKYVYFIFYIKSSTIEDMTHTFLRIVYINHKMLFEIIFNKNKLFTLKFWKLLINQLRTKHKLSTTYYL
jgi:hypothetical protein